MTSATDSPARAAARVAQARIHAAIDASRSFCVEAGAGAGKTYSLVEALNHVTRSRGRDLARSRQQVACITYTNVATDEIVRRTDHHPAIACSTIHAFCWMLIQPFQPFLRGIVNHSEAWRDILAENQLPDIGLRRIDYELGRRSINDAQATLHHDDIIQATVALLAEPKFRMVVASRFPIIFVDEYQDTDKALARALIEHVLPSPRGPLLGFFGDHWQQIYDDGCGGIVSDLLERIDKGANFRSVPVIVNALNVMRRELPQAVDDPAATGSVAIYHTNGWAGERQTRQPWTGDLPSDAATTTVNRLMERLGGEGWDFAPDVTKVLMLTHRVLAARQGYGSFVDLFSYNDSYIKREDPHMAFLLDVVEPLCLAYEERRMAQVFEIAGARTHAIQSLADKSAWARDLDALLALRNTGSIGEVLDLVRRTRRPQLSEAVESREAALNQQAESGDERHADRVARLQGLRQVPYQQVRALWRFVNDHTPFATKHSVKGAEFENVLMVVTRGWNNYNFVQFLERATNPPSLGHQDRERYERNRNLWYVCCSRPKRRLAVLFTQLVSPPAMQTLESWFGREAIRHAP
jgi:DNA helicase-2/ATP-dependent DNA helicase PcrA